jgi:1,4-alpha-glucan branching enzyme
MKQAARELLLAQASDWPFIMRTGTSPDYARQRIKDHILRFSQLYDHLKSGTIHEPILASMESADNLFPDINYRYWSTQQQP